MNLVGTPEHWLVTLTDRSVVCALMDISPQDQPGFDVVARTPGNPGRMVVTVALFPRPTHPSYASNLRCNDQRERWFAGLPNVAV